MIGYLHGTVFTNTNANALILVGGVGYRVTLLERVGSVHVSGCDASFFISPYVRDGALELYGFDCQDDMKLFERLISVSGVGPKSALAVLRLAPGADIRRAIVRGDADMLKKVSGIGGKTAQRIVIELKHEFQESPLGGGADNRDDIVDALVHLGYTRAAAREAAAHIPETVATPEDMIKVALKNIR